jgi:hypothetical protein
MIKARDLIFQQKEKEKNKYKIYDKIYELIEKKIIAASTYNYYYTLYEIPEFLIGYPIYSLDDCSIYIQNKLKSNEFKIEFYKPNIVFISWEEYNLK